MPSLPRAWYSAPTAEFLATSEETILGALSAGSARHGLDVTPAQTAAWQSQIDILKRELPGLDDAHSAVFFEFVIPRMGRRIDVVVLLPAAILQDHNFRP